MAIDTAAKRNAALLDPWAIIVPDGTIDDADRANLVGQYPVGSSSLTIAAYAQFGVRETAQITSKRLKW